MQSCEWPLSATGVRDGGHSLPLPPLPSQLTQVPSSTEQLGHHRETAHHRVQELNAPLQAVLGVTELPEEESSYRLLVAQTAVILFWVKEGGNVMVTIQKMLFLNLTHQRQSESKIAFAAFFRSLFGLPI